MITLKYFHITVVHVTIKTKVMGSGHDKYILFNASCFVIVAGYITVKTKMTNGTHYDFTLFESEICDITKVKWVAKAFSCRL